MAARNAANVLPEPVGAAIRALRPAWMSGHARCCGSVGSRKRDSNQRLMAGWKTGKHNPEKWGKFTQAGHPPPPPRGGPPEGRRAREGREVGSGGGRSLKK